MVSDRPGPLARADAAQRGILNFRSPVLRSILNPPGFGGVAPCWAGLRRGTIAQHLANDHAELQRGLRGIGFPGLFGYSIRILQYPTALGTSPTGPDRSLNCVPCNSPAAGSVARRRQTPRRGGGSGGGLPRGGSKDSRRPDARRDRTLPTPGDGRRATERDTQHLTEARNRQAAHGGGVCDAGHHESAARQAAESAFDMPAHGDGTVRILSKLRTTPPVNTAQSGRFAPRRRRSRQRPRRRSGPPAPVHKWGSRSVRLSRPAPTAGREPRPSRSEETPLPP